MKNFDKPSCEIVRFNGGVITTSTCGCYDPKLGDLGTDCTGDVGYCSCKVNYNPAEDNCTECTTNVE